MRGCLRRGLYFLKLVCMNRRERVAGARDVPARRRRGASKTQKCCGPGRPALRLWVLLLLTGFAPIARGDYAATVLSQGPVAYWRFNETNQPPPQPIMATNLGSLGNSLNGDLLNGVVRGGPGLLAGSGITSDRFTNSTWLVRTIGSYVNVPYTNALNPNGPFTVEFWAKPASMPPLDPPDAAESVFSTVCSLDTGLGPNCRMGYVFYVDGATGGWQFRIGNFNGYLAIAKGGTFTPG